MTKQEGAGLTPEDDARATTDGGAQRPIIAAPHGMTTSAELAADPRPPAGATAVPTATVLGAPASTQGLKHTQQGAAVGPQCPGQLPAKRARKRDREHEEQSQADFRWSLKRKIAALTRDVELLSHEVAKVRRHADLSCSDPQLTAVEKAALAEKHTRRVAEAQKRGISVLLRDIISHKWAFPFNQPVDTNMYKDYLLRVAKPMDFGTIRARLDAGLYTLNTEAFTADMRQVFQNAFTYNPPGSDVHSMALTLKDKFEERMKGLSARLAAVDLERQKEESELREIARRRLQEAALQGLKADRERFESTFSTLDARIKEAKSEAAQGCAFVTMEEKHAIVQALAELKVEEFEAAVQLVVNRHPGLLPPGMEEFDLELEPLDSLTLRQLSAFCRACQRGRVAGASPSWPGLIFGAGTAGDGSLRQPSSRAVEAQAATDTAAPAAPQPAVTHAAPAAATPLQPPAQIATPAAAQPTPKAALPAGLLHARHIGERSWSVLDRDAKLRASEARPSPLQMSGAMQTLQPAQDAAQKPALAAGGTAVKPELPPSEVKQPAEAPLGAQQ